MLNSDFQIRDYNISLFNVVIPIFYAIYVRNRRHDKNKFKTEKLFNTRSCENS